MEMTKDQVKHNEGAQVRSESWLDVLTKMLRSQSLEIAREGHNGWGNTMAAAAEAIDQLRSDTASTSNDKLRHGGE
jgi:hypothetical protein